MNLEGLLIEKKSAVVGRWLEAMLTTYPTDTQRFLREQKNHFSNPVGSTFSKELASLYTAFLSGCDSSSLAAILDPIVRIRAIQDFSPGQAIGFIFLLKDVIRNTFEKEILEFGLHSELLCLESRIDDLALLAFDVYMNCRERLYEIRSREAKNHVSGLLKKAGLVSEIPDSCTSSKENAAG
jgi:hypothetical protein